MDPITHTVFGAVAGHAVMHSKLGRGAILFGAAGGALPDIDVFWGFLADPALPWEHHRHFTHALAFIPIGGLLAAAPLLIFKRFRPHAFAAWLTASIGCATHGINDTFTSFGTFLYWPFSNQRAAWDVISIIDPLFTVPLILGLLLALIIARAWPTRIAFALSLLYVGLGFAQNQRVMNVQQQLADMRGHDIVRGRAMPTFGNIIIWRSLYEDADGYLHADAVRPGLLGPTLVHTGETVRRVTAAEMPGDPITGAYIAELFEKFSDFADGYVAHVDGYPNALGDMRYSMVAHSFSPMWGLYLTPLEAGRPVRWVGFAREQSATRQDAIQGLWQDLRRPGEHWVEVSSMR